jgi:hypothetical protein
VFKSSCFNISKLLTFTFGKKLFRSDDICSSKKSKLLSVICSNIKALNPPPNSGFNGLSPGLGIFVER